MKKTQAVVVIVIGLVAFFLQSFVQQGQGWDGHEKPKNLLFIQPDVSHDELMIDMRYISRALGVNCRYCHVVVKEGTDTEKPVYDAASDAKKEKLIARDMMLMTAAINTEYISKLSGDNKSKQITCVTCHMGQTKPLLNIDSLFRR